MQRRHVLKAGVLALMLPAVLTHAAAPAINVYKNASCGCCHLWVEHLQQNGFKVIARDVADPSDYRQRLGMPQELGSCHTATVNGYVLEGHVPAKEIKRLLRERPSALGLAVPSMPLGSPGMEGPRQDAYDVLLVQKNGKHRVFQHYNAS